MIALQLRTLFDRLSLAFYLCLFDVTDESIIEEKNVWYTNNVVFLTMDF